MTNLRLMLMAAFTVSLAGTHSLARTTSPSNGDALCPAIESIGESIETDVSVLIGTAHENESYHTCKRTLPGASEARIIHNGAFVSCMFVFFAGESATDATIKFETLKQRVFKCVDSTTEEYADPDQQIERSVGFFWTSGDYVFGYNVILQALKDGYVTYIEITRNDPSAYE